MERVGRSGFRGVVGSHARTRQVHAGAVLGQAAPYAPRSREVMPESYTVATTLPFRLTWA